MVDEATSGVELGALSASESRRVLACLTQRWLTKVALKSSEAFKDNCYFRDWSEKKAPVLCMSSALPPSRVMAESEADKTMQQSSLSRKPAEAPWWSGAASFVSDQIRDVPKMRSETTTRINRMSRLLSWWASKDDKARICFVSFQAPYPDLGHPITKALLLGWARPDPVGEGPVIGVPPTDMEPGFCSPVDSARIIWQQ